MGRSFFILVSCFLFLVPFLVLAQSIGQVDLTNVVPDIASTQGTGGAGFIGWIQNFYQFSLIAGVFLAVGVIAWAGLRYALAAGNPSGQSDARDQILQALLGLILLFGAYLILYTINPGLVNNMRLETLRSVSVGAPATTGGGTTGGRTGAGGGWGTGNDYTGGEGGTSGGAGASSCFNCLTDAQVRQTFGQAIQIKPGARVAGLQQSIVNAVLDLKSNCAGCEIVLTEGTGGVHQPGTYSHANGYKVDLRSLEPGTNTPNALTRYIEGNPSTFVPIGTRSDGAPQYRAPNGAIYARESNHWDVVVRGG